MINLKKTIHNYIIQLIYISTLLGSYYNKENKHPSTIFTVVLNTLHEWYVKRDKKWNIVCLHTILEDVYNKRRSDVD